LDCYGGGGARMDHQSGDGGRMIVIVG
jgi:hypothetical protein